MIRRKGIYGPMAEVELTRHAQVKGRFGWLASPDPNVSGPTNCNLQIGLQSAAIFGPGVVGRADGNALPFNGLHIRPGSACGLPLRRVAPFKVAASFRHAEGLQSRRQ